MADAFFVTNLFFGYDRRPFSGGMEIHLRSIINLLATRGIHSDVLQRWHTNELIHKDDFIQVQGVAIPFYLYNLVWKKKIGDNKKIIHLNDIIFSFPRIDKRVSATFHGVSWDIPTWNLPSEWTQQRFWFFKVNLLRKYYLLNTRYAIKRCRKILSVDNSLRYITQHEFPDYRDKIDVIPNFVDVDKFYPKNSTKQKFGLEAKDFVVLYPRNISLARGYFLLFEIMRKIARSKHNVKFLVVGGDLREINKDKYFRLLYYTIQKEKLMHHVHFAGSVPHAQMNDVFNASDIVIIPSLFGEGSSFAALESMACGKIVVASNIGGLNDIIIDGYNGFLVKPNSEAFVKKIMEIMDDNIMIKHVSVNALRTAKEIYSKKKWDKRVLEFFET